MASTNGLATGTVTGNVQSHALNLGAAGAGAHIKIEFDEGFAKPGLREIFCMALWITACTGRRPQAHVLPTPPPKRVGSRDAR